MRWKCWVTRGCMRVCACLCVCIVQACGMTSTMQDTPWSLTRGCPLILSLCSPSCAHQCEPGTKKFPIEIVGLHNWQHTSWRSTTLVWAGIFSRKSNAQCVHVCTKSTPHVWQLGWLRRINQLCHQTSVSSSRQMWRQRWMAKLCRPSSPQDTFCREKMSHTHPRRWPSHLAFDPMIPWHLSLRMLRDWIDTSCD